jgi:hypothetical protein
VLVSGISGGQAPGASQTINAGTVRNEGIEFSLISVINFQMILI